MIFVVDFAKKTDGDCLIYLDFPKNELLMGLHYLKNMLVPGFCQEEWDIYLDLLKIDIHVCSNGKSAAWGIYRE